MYELWFVSSARNTAFSFQTGNSICCPFFNINTGNLELHFNIKAVFPRFRIFSLNILCTLKMLSSYWNMSLICLFVPFCALILQSWIITSWGFFNTLRPRQNGHHFPDNILKGLFLNENVCIWIKISLKLVLKGPINNIPALVQIMAWCQLVGKPLSEPLMVRLSTHICVTWPQWVN